MKWSLRCDHCGVKVKRSGDPRYVAVVEKGFNKRSRARPDYVRLVSSTDQAAVAVEDAVMEGRRLVVTTGGHCFEGVVSDPGVRVIIDISPMKHVYFDRELGAVAVEAGATWARHSGSCSRCGEW